MAAKVVKQLAGDGSGQSFSDMMTAIKHTLTGTQVAKIICKATTEEMMPPKMKHLSALIGYTFQPQLSVPDFANVLLNRTQNNSLVVAFKAFITIHRLMQSGHECFFQYVASNNCRFNLMCLNERNTPQSHVLRVYVRVYADYLEEKARSYCDFGGDLCRLEVGKDGDIRTMSQPKLFKMIPIIERLLDALVAFDATANDLINPVLRVAHFCLYRDLIHLCAVHNAAMINILGGYFTMPKRDCQTALNLYKSFVNRSSTLNDFIRIAGSVDSGLTASDPEGVLLKPFPPAVLESLEQHLASLKNPSKEPAASSLSSSIRTSNVKKPSETDLTIASANRNGNLTPLELSAEQRRQIIEEERERLESFVHTVAHQSSSSSAAAGTNSQVDRFQDIAMDQLYANFDPPPAASVKANHPRSDYLPFVAPISTAAPTTTVAGPAQSSWLFSPDTTPTSKTSPAPFLPSAIPQAAQPSSFDPFSPGPRSTTTSTSLFTFPTAAAAAQNPINTAPVDSLNPFLPSTLGGVQTNSFQPMPNVNHTNASAISLDDRIAELASNLAIVPRQQQWPAEVDWSAAAATSNPPPRSFATANTSTGSMRNSSSANQLTGPAVQPASGLTNPWGHYPLPATDQVPFALTPAVGIPPASMTSWQSPVLPTLPVQQPATATRSTNPFL